MIFEYIYFFLFVNSLDILYSSWFVFQDLDDFFDDLFGGELFFVMGLDFVNVLEVK